MKYAKEHYEFMGRLSQGILAADLTDQELEILQFLDGEGITVTRASVQDGLWALSQKGWMILQAHKAELAAQEECIQKEQEQAAKEKAEQKAAQKSERAFQVFLVFLGAIVGAIIGNADRLIVWATSFFEYLLLHC